MVDACKTVEGGLFAFFDTFLLVVVYGRAVVLVARRMTAVDTDVLAITFGAVPLFREGRSMTREEYGLLMGGVGIDKGSSGCHDYMRSQERVQGMKHGIESGNKDKGIGKCMALCLSCPTPPTSNLHYYLLRCLDHGPTSRSLRSG